MIAVRVERFSGVEMFIDSDISKKVVSINGQSKD